MKHARQDARGMNQKDKTSRSSLATITHTANAKFTTNYSKSLRKFILKNPHTSLSPSKITYGEHL